MQRTSRTTQRYTSCNAVHCNSYQEVRDAEAFTRGEREDGGVCTRDNQLVPTHLIVTCCHTGSEQSRLRHHDNRTTSRGLDTISIVEGDVTECGHD